MQAVEILSHGLVSIAIAELGVDWMVAGAWLAGAGTTLLASAAIDVQADGAIARPLTLTPVDDAMEGMREALPAVQRRVEARGSGLTLPSVPDGPPPARDPQAWFERGYKTAVVIRRLIHANSLHRVACGVLFSNPGGERLLVGTDLTTPALVVSEDPALIDDYAQDCALFDLDRYRAEVA